MNGARYSYLSRLCELVEQGEDLIIVSDDYAAPVLDSYRRDYPERYVSVGIAEQNLIAVSCGLALAGKRVVAYGCAPFPITRAFDQIKNAAAMMHIPINIVSAGVGFAIPEWGATHYNAEDISLMRTIPGLRIITPTDSLMGMAAADYALVNVEPVYIRFDKYAEGEIYVNKEICFPRGLDVIEDGNDIAIITCGTFSSFALSLTRQWSERGICAKIIDLYSLPFDEDELLSAVGDLPILTLEEHILPGGIGSAILECFHEHGRTNTFRRLGIDFAGGYPQTSGSREHYLEQYGLSNDAITAAAVALAEVKDMHT